MIARPAPEPSTALADQFIAALARWQIAQHRATADDLLDELERHIKAAREGSMTTLLAALTCGIVGESWLRRDMDLLQAQP